MNLKDLFPPGEFEKELALAKQDQAMKCKHQNCTVNEEISYWIAYHIENGRKDEGFSPMGYPMGNVEVICNDCGMEKYYGKKKPKWLKNILEQPDVKE